MIRQVSVVESQTSSITLCDEEATYLAILGRELASSRLSSQGDEIDPNASVIGISRISSQTYNVTFREVIGVVSLPKIQFSIAPKIPTNHFNYLLSFSALAPRLNSSDVSVSNATPFLSVLCAWFVGALQILLRGGLRRGYVEREDELEAVQGQISVLPTYLANLSGRPIVHCSFEELSNDTALNRLIRAACSRVSSMPTVPAHISSKAKAQLAWLTHISPMHPSDPHVEVDSLHRKYAYIAPLAKLLVQGGSIDIFEGKTRGRAFLIRTPELIEDGVRGLLARRIPRCRIEKGRKALGRTGMTINPDLVFNGGCAVGDIKYRYFGNDWSRDVLNQAVTFAAGFYAPKCIVIGFSRNGITPISPVQVGDFEVTAIGWDVEVGYSPSQCADILVNSVSKWLEQLQLPEEESDYPEFDLALSAASAVGRTSH